MLEAAGDSRHAVTGRSDPRRDDQRGGVDRPEGVSGLVGSEGANGRGLEALLSHLGLEFDVLSLDELAVTGRFDGGVVREDIGRTVVRLDESVALLRVEPFHGTCGHILCILIQLRPPERS